VFIAKLLLFSKKLCSTLQGLGMKGAGIIAKPVSPIKSFGADAQ
jgi:hypothetical protein